MHSFSGGETCTEMALFGRAKRGFLESFLKPVSGVPSHDTFSRVFRLLNPEEFHTWFLGFMVSNFCYALKLSIFSPLIR